MPAALDLTLGVFLVNFQVTLKEKLLFSMPPAGVFPPQGNVPTFCPQVSCEG